MAERHPSGRRQPSQTSDAVALAVATEAQSLLLVGTLVVSCENLAVYLEAHVLAAHTPAVLETVFGSPAVVSSGRVDVAFEDLAAFEQHVLPFWVHTVAVLGALAA